MNSYPILIQSIPQGGFGRALTSTECTALRQAGHSCSQRYIVVRRVHNINYFGIVYKPGRTGGYDHTGLYVEVRD